MKILVQHTSHYAYDRPVAFSLQRARLRPIDNDRQQVSMWQVNVSGTTKQFAYRDGFANHVELLRADDDTKEVTITAQGLVETRGADGVMDKTVGVMPLFVYKSPTALTVESEAIRTLGSEARLDDPVGTLHNLMDGLSAAVTFDAGSTSVVTTSAEALEGGRGVCQDFTHIFLAAARSLGFAARYASGYFVSGGDLGGDAMHGWAEIYIESLGWTGFDPTNRKCPDENYVRVAIGRDYSEAAPISGILYGDSKESLDVRLMVEQ